MKIIGITGGVGAGKTHILAFIEEKYKARIIKTDEAAEFVRTPGHEGYERIVELLGTEILNEDKTINKNKMAAIIFADKEKLEKINEIMHPAVNRYVAEEIEIEKQKLKRPQHVSRDSTHLSQYELIFENRH